MKIYIDYIADYLYILTDNVFIYIYMYNLNHLIYLNYVKSHQFMCKVKGKDCGIPIFLRVTTVTTMYPLYGR